MFLKPLIAALGALACCAATAAPVLWISDDAGRLAQVDVATGATTIVGDMGQAMYDIAFDPLGQLWGIGGSGTDLYRIDATTGASTLVGATGAGGINSLVFGADGTLYGANTGLFTINTLTGAATLVGNGTAYSSAGDLAFVAGRLYLASSAPDASLWELDIDTGTGTHIGNTGVSNMFGLASADNITLYGQAGQNIYNIDTGSGLASHVVSFAGGGLGAAYGTAFRTEAGASEVPEPATLPLAALALLGLGYARRTHRLRR